MSIDASWYDEHYPHYRQRNLMKDVAFKQYYKPTAMELKNGNTWRKVHDHWRQEFLTLYSNGVLAFFNEPYGTCSGIINTRSNILDIHTGQSIPVPFHRLPLLPEWALMGTQQLVLVRGHRENFYFLFQSPADAKSWVLALNSTRAMIPGQNDIKPPQPGFYPFGEYVPPGYPKLNTRLPDNKISIIFPQAPPTMPPAGDSQGIPMSPRKLPTRRRPVALEKVEDERPFGWTDPIEKPVYQLPDNPGLGWTQNQKSNYFFHGGQTLKDMSDQRRY